MWGQLVFIYLSQQLTVYIVKTKTIMIIYKPQKHPNGICWSRTSRASIFTHYLSSLSWAMSKNVTETVFAYEHVRNDYGRRSLREWIWRVLSRFFVLNRFFSLADQITLYCCWDWSRSKLSLHRVHSSHL